MSWCLIHTGWASVIKQVCRKQVTWLFACLSFIWCSANRAGHRPGCWVACNELLEHAGDEACLLRVYAQVLSGCPWVLPRPIFVLTSQQWGWQAADGIQSTYTLRTKVVQEGAADAIAKVCACTNAVPQAVFRSDFTGSTPCSTFFSAFRAMFIRWMCCQASKALCCDPMAQHPSHVSRPCSSPCPAAAEQAAPGCSFGCG